MGRKPEDVNRYFRSNGAVNEYTLYYLITVAGNVYTANRDSAEWRHAPHHKGWKDTMLMLKEQRIVEVPKDEQERLFAKQLATNLPSDAKAFLTNWRR